MDEKEKYRIEMDTKITRLGDTLHEIKNEMERRKESFPETTIHSAIENLREASLKLREIETLDKGSLEQRKVELESLVDDIDNKARKAMAHFK